MLILSYNCLNKLNIYSMHFFRFQKTWFYPADLGCPRPGYQTMSIIKGTLRYNSREGGEKWGFRGIVQRFKRYIKRAKVKEFVSYPWDHSKYHLASKEIYAKTCTHQISLSPTKSSSPNYLERQCLSKATWTWVPNLTSLLQKH